MLCAERKLAGSVLYMSTIAWSNTKQRPQYTSEYLGRSGYEVTYLTINRSTKGPVGARKPVKNVKRRSALMLPRVSPFSRLNWPCRIYNRVISGKHHDYLFVTQPQQFLWIVKASGLTSQVLIYDCMDNCVGFYENPVAKRDIEQAEAEICSCADVIITSSDFLKRILVEKYNLKDERVAVINNGYEPALFNDTVAPTNRLRTPNVVYAGTVARWLDVKAICELAVLRPELWIYLVGPIHSEELRLSLSRHKNIMVTGAIEYYLVPSLIAASDAVMVPFKVDELTQGVDPVKAYEYIAMGKRIVSTYWKEMEKFRDYCSFYEEGNGLSLDEALHRSVLQGRRCKQETAEFLENASWERRIARIIRLIQNAHDHSCVKHT